MAITLRQSASGNTGGSASLSVAYGSAVAAGSTLIAAVGIQNNLRTINSFSDTVFGNWTQAVISGTNVISAIYYLPNATVTTGTPTVGVGISGNSAIALAITEWTGLSQLIDKTGAAHGASAGTNVSVSTSGSTTAPAELVFAAGATTSTGSWTAGAGYTLIQSNTNVGCEYQVTSISGTQTATLTIGSSLVWDATIATFFPALVAAPLMTRRYTHYYI